MAEKKLNLSQAALDKSNEYLQEKRVTDLFQCLTAALVHSRPERHVDFLLQCLDQVADLGYENVFWDTFIQEVPVTSQSRSANATSFSPSVSNVTGAANTPQSVEMGGLNAKQDKAKDSKTKTENVNDRKTNEKINSQNEEVDRSKDTTQPGDDEHESNELVRQLGITDPEILAIYKGRLQNIPKLPTNAVRIFLSSTFSDFRAERNILPRDAYPKLQEFCRERGLDFQVIDMRWGVTDEMLNDHQVTDLCIREIEHCQQVSCGPNFVTLIGNRYGYRPFPSVIGKQEYEVLMSQVPPENDETVKKLFSTWFREDENAVPVSYVLQPIASILDHFNDEANSDLYKRDRQRWDDDYEALRANLVELSHKAFFNQLIAKPAYEKYQISVTEHEIEAGLLRATKSDGKAVCYVRDLDGLTNYLNKKNTSRFIDTVPSNDDPSTLAIDKDAQDKLEALKDSKIAEKIKSAVQRQYSTEWKGVNLEESGDEKHLQYLKNFCHNFVIDIKNMIEKHLHNKESSIVKEYDSALYHEIVHHAKFACNKLTLFCGREEELAKIKDLIVKEKSERPPIAVYAQSGHGKTAILAKCAELVPIWLDDTSTAVITRFFGTSPESSNIRDALLSVIAQIATILDYTLPQSGKLERMVDVRNYFQMLITRIGELHQDIHFVIILDSIDQLSDLYGAHRLSWLPRTLPKNVQIIVSVLSDFGKLLENCYTRIGETNNFIRLNPLPAETAIDIMHSYMKLHNRTLTNDQQERILEAFKSNAQPLYLKLVLDRALQWASYTDMDTIIVPSDVRAAIEMLFGDLEAKYGEVFVKHALSYLTCGNGGLTDIEMDDILSCDDDVLDEVYKYHDPPLKGTIRIPSLLWARLGHEIKEYLTDKEVDNKTVKTWYHRQFKEAAEGHYLSDSSHYANMHSKLGQLFLQTNGIKRTITLTKRKNKIIENADRRVTPQILSTSNPRKLNSLPYHLIRGKDFVILKSECLLNFDFLFTKMRTVGMPALFAEFQEIVATKSLGEDRDILLMSDFFELTFDAIHLDTNLFPFFAKERLGPYVLEEEHKDIKPLLEKAREWLANTTEKLLIPINPLNMKQLSSPIKFSHLLGYTGAISPNEEIAVCVWKPTSASTGCMVLIFDLVSREIISTTRLSKESPPPVITKDNKHFLLFNNEELCLHELYTGDLKKTVDILDMKYTSITVRCMRISDDGKWLVVVLKLGKPSDLKENSQWRTTGRICCVDLATVETQNETTTSIPYHSKKHVENVLFVNNNSKLVAAKRDGIIVYDIPSLNKLHEYPVKSGHLNGLKVQYVESQSKIIGPITYERGCSCLVLDCDNYNVTYSPKVHCDISDLGEEPQTDSTQPKRHTQEELSSFGTISNPDFSQILIGTNSTGFSRNGRLWVWNIGEKTVQRIVISQGQWRIATHMIVMQDWDHVIIGYQTGDISVVSLSKEQEIRDVHAHGNIVNFIQLIDQDKHMITMATDQTLQIWNVHHLLTGKDEVVEDLDEDTDIVPLDTREQVLGLQVNNQYAVSVAHLTKQGPRFWDLKTGIMNKELTKFHENMFVSSIADISELGGPRYHGSIELIDDFFIYQRKRRNGFLIYVAKVSAEDEPIAVEFFLDSFFSLAVPGSKDRRPCLYIVRDGVLERRILPTLAKDGSASMPKITDGITNLDSKNGKRKLIYYRIGITLDSKHFLIVNPGHASGGRYIDWIDVEKMKYQGRGPLFPQVSWKILQNSFCYFLIKSDTEFSVYRPTPLRSSLPEHTYMCPVYGGTDLTCLLSSDFKLGAEIKDNFNILIWDVQQRSEQFRLIGHTSEVNSTHFSQDNHLFSSASIDNTVRVWSLHTGDMLCLFHLYGNVRYVLMSPDKQYIVAQYYSAPQRTRAAILKLWNVDE